MENTEKIHKYYKEAVRGLNEPILRDKDLWYSYVINLPIHLQILYSITIFHQQVLNGGFHQYFFNSYGQFAYLTLDHLKLIKAFKTAEVLEQALNRVNIEKYSHEEFRERIFNRQLEQIANFDDQLGDFLNDLDNKYYAIHEPLDELFINYLKDFNVGE